MPLLSASLSTSAAASAASISLQRAYAYGEARQSEGQPQCVHCLVGWPACLFNVGDAAGSHATGTMTHHTKDCARAGISCSMGLLPVMLAHCQDNAPPRCVLLEDWNGHTTAPCALPDAASCMQHPAYTRCSVKLQYLALGIAARLAMRELSS